MTPEDQKRNEYVREFHVNGMDFVATRDTEYSMWTLHRGKHTLNGRYTTFEKAKEGAHNYSVKTKGKDKQ